MGPGTLDVAKKSLTMDPHLATKYFIPSPSKKKHPHPMVPHLLFYPLRNHPPFHSSMYIYRYRYIWFHILLNHHDFNFNNQRGVGIRPSPQTIYVGFGLRPESLSTTPIRTTFWSTRSWPPRRWAQSKVSSNMAGWKIPELNGVFVIGKSWKITYFHGPFPSTPCLMTPKATRFCFSADVHPI